MEKSQNVGTKNAFTPNIYHIISYGENKKNICEIFYFSSMFQATYYHGFKNWTEAKIVFAFSSWFNQVFD